jgi:hypothetical protein
VSSEVSDLSAKTAQVRAEIKSLVLKNLLTNPVFQRLYERILVQKGYKPNEAKILADRYRNFSGATMSSQSCTHIKVTGVRCNSPALRGEQFCYFHQRMHRGVRTPPQARLHPIALIEDEESIQTALMEVINALMRNTIGLKRAGLILRALHIAVKNAGRVKIGSRSSVTEIPNYAAPEAAEAETNHVGTDCVGTDAFVRPATLNEVKGSHPTTDLNEANENEWNEFRHHSELDIPASAEPQLETPNYRTPIERPRILTAAERAARRAEIEAAIASCLQQPNPPTYASYRQQEAVHPAHITEDGQAHLTPDHVGTGTPARAGGPEVSGRQHDGHQHPDTSGQQTKRNHERKKHKRAGHEPEEHEWKRRDREGHEFHLCRSERQSSCGFSR